MKMLLASFADDRARACLGARAVRPAARRDSRPDRLVVVFKAAKKRQAAERLALGRDGGS
ncbi:hypothetical protein AWC15_18750 [Mycobacterium lacus]|nr:hypothetical protein AWC15_18750 [Mycobacterium lacus]